MKKRKRIMHPWPPAELLLPDSIEEIERGRPPKQQSLFEPDDSREGRVRRLLAKRASRLRPPMPQHAEDCGVEWW